MPTYAPLAGNCWCHGCRFARCSPVYGHVGPELILKEGQDYVFLDAHDADRLSIGDFWRDFGDAHLKDHALELYLSNIQGKIERGAQQVAYMAN